MLMCSQNFPLFSVGFYQMAKIAVTPTIVVAEFMIFQKRVSSQKVGFDEMCLLRYSVLLLSHGITVISTLHSLSTKTGKKNVKI